MMGRDHRDVPQPLPRLLMPLRQPPMLTLKLQPMLQQLTPWMPLRKK